jgi:prepilin-type N-terminal cleavage/methylation domain-containing protein
MKGFFKQNKGFSLVELLIALLIMAIIAATAITLFGGVLETSRGGADRETADAIKRAILTYMNAANDPDLSALGIKDDSMSQVVVNQLACKVTIGTDKKSTIASIDTNVKPDIAAGTAKDKEIPGTFGPFLEEFGVKPTQDGMKGWEITIDKVNQIIEVKAAAADAKVKFK